MNIFINMVDVYHTHTPTVVFFGFILPMFINGFEFTLRTIKEYRADLSRRAMQSHHYVPTLTLGHVLARLLGIFTPFINFIVMFCNLDRVFEWIGEIFTWFGRLFDIPLVPKR